MHRGEKIHLTPLDPANAETVRHWVLDPEVNRWMLSGHEPITPEEELYFFAESLRLAKTGTAYRFEIHANEDGALLGICGLENVDSLHRHGDAGIFIAPPERWSKGFGADALRTLLVVAFAELGLHRVSIGVFGENARARELYERLGFTEVGRDREAYLLEGEYRDLVRLDILDREWVAGTGGCSPER
jgi:RimJ/RimL family protein N-acetyltransferase